MDLEGWGWFGQADIVGRAFSQGHSGLGEARGRVSWRGREEWGDGEKTLIIIMMMSHR